MADRKKLSFNSLKRFVVLVAVFAFTCTPIVGAFYFLYRIVITPSTEITGCYFTYDSEYRSWIYYEEVNWGYDRIIYTAGTKAEILLFNRYYSCLDKSLDNKFNKENEKHLNRLEVKKELEKNRKVSKVNSCYISQNGETWEYMEKMSDGSENTVFCGTLDEINSFNMIYDCKSRNFMPQSLYEEN